MSTIFSMYREKNLPIVFQDKYTFADCIYCKGVNSQIYEGQNVLDKHITYNEFSIHNCVILN